MEHPEEHYYKLNRFFLSVSGLWPYQSKRSARLIRVIITVIILSSVFFQISNMFTVFTSSSLEFIVDEIPMFLIVLGNLTNLYTRIGHIDKFRELFDRMSNDWALQKTPDEIKIMHEHAKISRLFTFFYMTLIYTAIGLYSIWLFIPEVLNIVSPMNESRPHRQPFNLEFFVDEERYFYFIRSHICLVLFSVPLVFIASSSLFLTLAQHACGMCELLGHRVERLFCVIKDEARCDLIQVSQINRGNMTVFIRQHYNVIQFIDIIETCHTLPFLIDLGGIVILLSLTLIQIFNISDAELAIRSIGICATALSYIFVSCYMGQRVMDVSSSICEKIFNSAWYNADVSDQKALLMIMMRRCHPLILTACRFYVMSLQNFGMILQTVISYCMFIRQI